MQVLHDSAWEAWQRVQTLDLRLRQRHAPVTRRRLRRKRHTAVQQFRRAYIEQQVRLRAA